MDSQERIGTGGRRGRQVLVVVALAVAALWIDWRPAHRPSSRVIDTVQSAGPVSAGASRVPLTFSEPVPIAGYARQGREPTTEGSETLAIRALALRVGERTIALVSTELLVVPSTLRAAVLARLTDPSTTPDSSTTPDALVLTATHTHSGPGGYWKLAAAEHMGMGAYDPAIESRIADAIAAAVRESLSRLQPARMSVGRIEASSFGLNRNGFGTTDPLLTALRVDAADGAPVGRVVVYAAHPTITARNTTRLSGDWPGALMNALEEDGGVSLFVQGASGDVTWGKRAGEMSREERVVRFGRAVASDARGAIAAAGEGAAESTLSFARVRVSLPPADARGLVATPFARPASNLLHLLLRTEATDVSWLRLGDASFLFLPAEPVAELGVAWRALFDGATVVSLADDYVGYVELPARIEAQQGEARRSYFGPSLAPVLLDGLTTARSAAEPDRSIVDR